MIIIHGDLYRQYLNGIFFFEGKYIYHMPYCLVVNQPLYTCLGLGETATESKGCIALRADNSRQVVGNLRF